MRKIFFIISLCVLCSIILHTLSFSCFALQPELDHIFEEPQLHALFSSGWFGTDELGRSVFYQIILSLLNSFYISLISLLISLIVGILIALISVTYQGWFSSVLLQMIPFFLGFPLLIIAMLCFLFIDDSRVFFIVILSLYGWAYFARLMRNFFISEVDKAYYINAVTLGQNAFFAGFKHLVPNALAAFYPILLVRIAHNIMTEASLSYLGFGGISEHNSIGELVMRGQRYLHSGQYWVSLYPGLILVICLALIFYLGDIFAKRRQWV